MNALATFSCSSSETLDPGTVFLPFKHVLEICCWGGYFHLPVTDGLLSSSTWIVPVLLKSSSALTCIPVSVFSENCVVPLGTPYLDILSFFFFTSYVWKCVVFQGDKNNSSAFV